MKNKFLCMVALFVLATSFGQNNSNIDTTSIKAPNVQKLKYKQLIIPTVLIGYGVVGLNDNGLKNLNCNTRDEIVENGHCKFTVDDFLQYTPALSVYALNNIGIKGKHNLKDRSVILATSLILVATSVTTLKKITKIERPDGTNNDSFPSGHTALAFAGAEFLYQEYKDVSLWYGVSGYIAASATGVLRMYNNKHWLTDVAAGAGFGILSTKAAYWLSPYLNKHIFPSLTGKSTAMFMPMYDGKQLGGAFVMSF
jgi:membrane-associated phospholipid phosphatase